MNNIDRLDSQYYNILHNCENSVDDNFYNPLTDKLQEFVSLALQTGMIATILQGQSVMTHLDTRPSLSAPVASREKIDLEKKNNLIGLAATMNGCNITILEYIAALTAPIFQLHNINNMTNENNILPVSTPSTAATTRAAYSRIPVKGGADVGMIDVPKFGYVNLIGDPKDIQLKNLLAAIFTKQEFEFNKQATLSSIRAVDAAERSGNKVIAAEKQRAARDITSGVIGVAGQGATTARTTKALNTESKSITNNLAAASKVEAQQMSHQATVASSTDGLLHKGVPLNDSVAAALNSGSPITAGFSAAKRHDHNQVQLNTSKVKVTSDYSNAIIHSGQKIVESGFNTAAANETKEAELARADQTVNNEIANVYQLAAKKSAESGSTLNQAFENMLNSKNSTLSSIVGGMR